MIDKLAVGEDGDARGEALGERALVGDHDDGHSERVLDFAEEEKDLLAGGAVEIAGGLVGEEDCGLIYQRAGEGAALLLAAGEFAGAMLGAGREANAVESLLHAAAALGAIDFGQPKRKLDIFFERHAWEKIEGLEYHADGFAAITGEAGRVEGGEIFALNVDGACGGAVQSGHEIEQGGLAGPGAAEEGEEFTGSDFEREVVDGTDGGFAEAVVAGDVIYMD